jgi:hypothetical protein
MISELRYDRKIDKIAALSIGKQEDILECSPSSPLKPVLAFPAG